MSYELDEIIPFSRGGSAIDYDNVQPVHRICNQKKCAKMPQDLVKKPVVTPSREW